MKWMDTSRSELRKHEVVHGPN